MSKYDQQAKALFLEHFFSDVNIYEKPDIDILAENRFHRYLNFSFDIQRPKECYGSQPEGTHINFGSYRDPEIERIHEKLGIKTLHVETFYTPPNSSLPIHSDEWPMDGHVKINLTWGPDDGVIRWWEPKNGPLTIGHYYDTIITDRENYDLVYTANTNKPSLVNIGRLHDTYNPSNEGRWTLCMVPVHPDNSYITWDDAMIIYKDYLI